MAEKAIDDLHNIAMTMQEIGSYTFQDAIAFKALVLNLVNAMTILDPARSDAALREKTEQYTASEDIIVAEPYDIGQYL